MALKKSKPYYYPEKDRVFIRNWIKKMLEIKVIRPSISPMSCPLVLRKYADKDPRPVFNFRYLNQFIIGLEWPSMSMKRAIEEIRGADWYSLCDMPQAFYFIPIFNDHCWKLAFI